MNTFSFSKIATAVSFALALPLSAQALEFSHLSTFIEECNNGESCAEISVFDEASSHVFVTNAEENELRILSVNYYGQLDEFAAIDLSPFGGAPNSVAVKNGIVAVAVEATVKQDNGTVELFDTDGNHLKSISVGALPDMLTFTPNGKFLIVANEGEPNSDYTIDPEGSVSIIDTDSWRAKTADFSQFNQDSVEFYDKHSRHDRDNHHHKDKHSNKDALKDVRVFGPNASFSQDMEPEYIAVSADSKYAWISLQENNALAKLDIRTATITDIYPLGYKNHSVEPNVMDASNKDDTINITTWPTLGMYMPDSIDAFEYDGETFIVSANEGDSRDYDGYSEEARVKDIDLDPTAFPNAVELQQDDKLGRLKITTSQGDTDGDGDFDKLYSYGTRSFSVWSESGQLVFDSGSILERTLKQAQIDHPELKIWEDSRSDDKGPEPESIAIGKLGDKTLAFVGTERTSDIFIFDISNPYQPEFIDFIDIDNVSGDISPEGLHFIARDETTGWLLISNEISNSTSLYEIKM
jgi:hypothetical protein